jgi:hypothetical protein
MVGDADVRARGQFEATADDRALQRRQHRYRAVFDRGEGTVPHPGMLHAGQCVVLVEIGEIGEIQAGREVRAVRRQHDRAHRRIQGAEVAPDAQHGGFVERIALVRTGERQHTDRRAALTAQRRRQLGCRALCQRVPPLIHNRQET